MLYGIRPREQERLAAAGDTVRVYVPYGDEWYGYLMRRLAERPANLVFFLRALASTAVTRPSRCSASASSARRCCPGCCAPARRPGRMLAAERHPERAAEIAERYGVATPTPEEATAERRRRAAGGQAAGHAGAAHRRRPARAARHARRVDGRRHHRPRWSRSCCPAGTPVVRVMTNTPVFVDEAMSAISAGSHATAEHLAARRGPARARSARSCACPSRSRTP